MFRMLMCSLAIALMLAGCGGAKQEEPRERQKSTNPLADEQQAIRDAEMVQGLLEQDTAEKKKALDESR